MAGAMRINSTACLFILSILSNNAYCRETENGVPVRYERGNLQEYMGDSSNPNFWPVRGRRSEAFDDSFGPFRTINLGRDVSFRRGGREPRKKEEETTGVFWAGRGRSYDVANPDDGNFWAHRGRSLEPWSEATLPRNRLAAEEPGWIWIVRGETQIGKTPKPGEEDRTCSNVGKTKREILRQRLCHLKRKANTLLREIPQTEQFWPVRGKREEESWQENLRDSKTVWPARGSRDEDAETDKDKQPVNGKEVTLNR